MAAEKSDEIQEIMKDINGIRAGMVEAVKAAPAPAPATAAPAAAAPDPMADFHSGSSEHSMEDTLGGMKEEASSGGQSILDAESEELAKMVEESLGEAPQEDLDQPLGMESEESLTLSLKGSMTLKLKYDFEGQEVAISFEDHCLKVQLSDGTEFKIPIGNRLTRVA